ncbi:MAG: DUF4124 domain-containing protein [Methylotenera sp.]|nr:DUF4124 domain-containing protein [Methylotenera sp.]
MKTVVLTQQKASPSVAQKSLFQSLGLLNILILLSMTLHANAESSKIVKWKDDKGVTHYGDKIPAQYSNTENSIINQQGITVKRNKPMTFQDESLIKSKIEQDKKDKALLSAFTNENEIDLARDRNLQLDRVTIEGLQLQRNNSQKRLSDNQKSASTFTAKKKPVPADLAGDVKNNQDEIAKIDKQIDDRKTSMEATRKRFDEDKKRYIALKNYANGSGSAPATPSAIAPSTPTITPASIPTTAPATTNAPPPVPPSANPAASPIKATKPK